MSVDRIIAEGRRTKRYADYVQRRSLNRIEPVSFRVFAEAEDEYDRKWEVANYEYEREVKGGEGVMSGLDYVSDCPDCRRGRGLACSECGANLREQVNHYYDCSYYEDLSGDNEGAEAQYAN